MVSLRGDNKSTSSITISLPNPPVLETPDHLLDEDDLVSDGFVSLNLQQHVMVILHKGQLYLNQITPKRHFSTDSINL